MDAVYSCCHMYAKDIKFWGCIFDDYGGKIPPCNKQLVQVDPVWAAAESGTKRLCKDKIHRPTGEASQHFKCDTRSVPRLQ